VLEKKGENARALADFAAALERDPNVLVTLLGQGIALERLGHLERALAELETALRVDPKLDSAIRGRDRVRAALAAAGERK
jgi:tetratricopeptide (TPR) repeat protein